MREDVQHSSPVFGAWGKFRRSLKVVICVVLSTWGLAGVAGTPPSPFLVTATVSTNQSVRRVTFNFTVPPQHILYADRLAFEAADGKLLKPAVIPEPVLHRNELSGQERMGYEKPFSVELEPGDLFPLELTVKFQGCSNNACYFPERHAFNVTAVGVIAREERPTETNLAAGQGGGVHEADKIPGTNGFRIAARETGYVPKKSFLNFLERSRGGAGAVGGLGARLTQAGPIASFCLILAGGVGLNLTPCVLPLIPINLAIIGAGVRASSRRRGFALGGAYGFGMAAAYGLLGLVVVLTGAKFGTLNSSAWFNLGIALFFLVMALAMFDWINVDFSRFQGSLGSPGTTNKGRFALAFSMGAMAALLAGACVAPVVISVLLLASQFYAKGIMAGLLLPFLLGIGMAAPWPFAGAGLSFLPKPGKWMKWVKYSFGVLILLFATYYGDLALNLSKQSTSLRVAARTQSAGAVAASPEAELEDTLQHARSAGRPVLIDFAASWCKNCTAMDSTVFCAPEVKEKLKEFVVVRYDAERPNDPPAREVLDRFGVMGLPTYVVLVPEK